jgi:hypothetical protein
MSTCQIEKQKYNTDKRWQCMGTLESQSQGRNSNPKPLLVNMISDMPRNKKNYVPPTSDSQYTIWLIEISCNGHLAYGKPQILQIVLSYICISQHYLLDGRIAVLECIYEE